MALSNKIFTYLLAGVPVLLSRTPAHEQLAKDLGDATLLVDLSRPAETAREIETFLDDPGQQERARNSAWRLARERYNWDVEGMKFLQKVRNALR
jgi:glycosyltransferase involved in cell wall biosynthesis